MKARRVLDGDLRQAGLQRAVQCGVQISHLQRQKVLPGSDDLLVRLDLIAVNISIGEVDDIENGAIGRGFGKAETPVERRAGLSIC